MGGVVENYVALAIFPEPTPRAERSGAMRCLIVLAVAACLMAYMASGACPVRCAITRHPAGPPHVLTGDCL